MSKPDWTCEDEGKLANLLREFLRCERETERAPLLRDLAEMAGVDFGDRPGRWLSWYVQEHLGLREAIERLAGEDARGDDPLPDKLLADEQVFEHPEYNWCALDRVKNKDDMQKLRMLYSDLESPIRSDAEGPLSFRRLSGADRDDLAFFHGKSVTQALFADGAQVRHLRILKDYGKMMMNTLLPSATQRAGTVVYAAAIAQALVRFDAKITSLSYRDLKESLPGLMDRPYITERYTELLRQAMEKCG